MPPSTASSLVSSVTPALRHEDLEDRDRIEAEGGGGLWPILGVKADSDRRRDQRGFEASAPDGVGVPRGVVLEPDIERRLNGVTGEDATSSALIVGERCNSKLASDIERCRVYGTSVPNRGCSL